MTAASTKTVKLLVADDNPLVRDLIVKGMEPFCEVETAADGADALLKVIDNPPDVILCDYKMPGLDGRQLFEKLRGREATRHIPFLFMASRADIEERLRPLVDGVEDFVTKAIFREGSGAHREESCGPAAPGKIAEARVAPRRNSGAARRDEHDRPDAVARNGAEIVPAGGESQRRAGRAVFCEWAVPRCEERKSRRRRRGLQRVALDRRRVRD